MGCSCLVALASAFSPRLALALVWLFSDRLTQALDSGWVGILGFLFLPWTTLAWAVAYQPASDLGVTGIGWFLVVFAFLVDLSTHAGSSKARSDR